MRRRHCDKHDYYEEGERGHAVFYIEHTCSRRKSRPREPDLRRQGSKTAFKSGVTAKRNYEQHGEVLKHIPKLSACAEAAFKHALIDAYGIRLCEKHNNERRNDKTATMARARISQLSTKLYRLFFCDMYKRLFTAFDCYSLVGPSFFVSFAS